MNHAPVTKDERAMMHIESPSRLTIRSALLVAGAVAAISFGCSKSDGGPRGPLDGEMPQSVVVSGGSVTAGTTLGRVRHSYALDAFKITRSPIRVREYRECVSVGACTEPALKSANCLDDKAVPARHATYGLGPNGDDLAVNCVTPAQAIAYCGWVGGQLPNEQQWLLAARGPDIHQYSWGDSAPTCEQHPLGSGASSNGACCRDDCNQFSRFTLGKRSAAASPSGVEDVLVTEAELLAGAPDALSSACVGPSSSTCVVTSRPAGAITSFGPMPLDLPKSDKPLDVVAFGFRCAWSEAGK